MVAIRLLKAILVEPPSSEPARTRLLRRTERSLAHLGIEVAARCASFEEARAYHTLEREGAPSWVLSAGAMPYRAPGPTLPLPGSTSNFSLVGYSFRRGTLTDAHHAFEHATGGDSRHRTRRGESVAFDSILVRGAGPWPHAVHATALDVDVDLGLRVGELVTSLHRGGAERVFVDTVHLLRNEGQFVVPLVLDRGKRSELAPPAGTRTFYVRGASKRERVSDLLQAIAELGLDVVHAHLVDPETLASIKALGIPVVVTVHNTRPGWPPGYEALGSEHASLLFGCGKLVTQELAAETCLPLRVLSNAVLPATTTARRQEVRAALGLSDAALVLVCVANLRAQKRLDRVPGIVQELAARGEDAHAIILGESLSDGVAVQARIADECAQRSVTHRVHLLGPKEDVLPFLTASDVFLSTSDFEGLSIAQLEAIQAGLPLVLTEVGGVRELWEAQGRPDCMQVLPPGSSASTYADAIRIARTTTERASLAAVFTPKVHARRLREQLVEHTSEPPREGVLLITNNFATGGAQSSARRLLRALAQDGRRVGAIVIEENPRAPTVGLRALRATGITVHAARNAREHDALDTTADVVAFAREHAFETIVFWNVIAEHKVLIADALSARRLFDVSPGEMYFSSLARYFENPRKDLPYTSPRDYGALLEGIVVKYDDEQQRALAVLGAKVTVIPNGVDLATPRDTERQGMLLGTVARLSPDKKLEELFAAFRLLRAASPDVRLRVLGGVDGAHAGYAESLRATAPKGVEFVDETDDASTFLDELDVFAMISEPAGCPNALLEAMAHGLPIVATDVGGAGQLLGGAGQLVPRADAGKLAQALTALLENPAERARFCGAARKRVESEFSLRTMRDRYASLFFPSSRLKR